MDWDSFRFIDLFAGIGGIRLGFESVGGHCVFSSEFDKDACTTYEANFGEYSSGDITKTDAADIPDFDILLGGFLDDVKFKFPDPVPVEERKKPFDILETDIDHKYYVRDKIRLSVLLMLY